MTNHWIDMKNADVILIMGSNAAENHPISFKWIQRARDERNAKLIVVDPRFTRTAAKADIYAPIRSGTDVAFAGGLINYVIQTGNYNDEYVKLHTNGPWIVDDKFGFDSENGVYSGFVKTGEFEGSSFGHYNKKEGGWTYKKDANGNVVRDLSLQDPRCVFQFLKRHYSRYTPEVVEKITGCPKEKFLEVAKVVASCGRPDKVMTHLYAMGLTQHTFGTQNIRTFVILQLLLGDIGLAGGGINALRGESNVQGSTDMCLLFHTLPGYLKCPIEDEQTLQQYLDKWTPKPLIKGSVNYWKNYPKFMVSLLKAWWGANATKDNDFGYSYLPKRDKGKNYSHIMLFEQMFNGHFDGAFLWGQNVAVGGPDSNKERAALGKLKWMVCVDLFHTETAEFWRRPGVNPSDIKTEVFLLPAAASYEKEGSITNSGRWAQWRWKAVNPPGEAKPDSDITNLLFKRIINLYKEQGGTFPDPIVKSYWPYGEEINVEKDLLTEINGFDWKTRKRVANFTKLKDDGSTACGNWLYSGVYPEEGNLAKRRNTNDETGTGLYPNFAWCWPVNRRIIYNRASCDDKGRPWCPDRPVIWWDGSRWIGDVPDYGKTTPPDAVHKGVGAFIMLPEGVSRIWAPGLKDGPFPEFYEPIEAPVKNYLHPKQNFSPALWLDMSIVNDAMNKKGNPDKYPYVAFTNRVAEHYQSGAITRNIPYLVELMPDMFVEIPVELAKEKGIKNGGKVRVTSARGSITGVAIVTHRMMPLNVNGKKIYQISMPWEWGYRGLARGDSANKTTPHWGDPNTMIPEFKGFLVDIAKA